MESNPLLNYKYNNSENFNSEKLENHNDEISNQNNHDTQHDREIEKIKEENLNLIHMKEEENKKFQNEKIQNLISLKKVEMLEKEIDELKGFNTKILCEKESLENLLKENTENEKREVSDLNSNSEKVNPNENEPNFRLKEKSIEEFYLKEIEAEKKKNLELNQVVTYLEKNLQLNIDEKNKLEEVNKQITSENTELRNRFKSLTENENFLKLNYPKIQDEFKKLRENLEIKQKRILEKTSQIEEMEKKIKQLNTQIKNQNSSIEELSQQLKNEHQLKIENERRNLEKISNLSNEKNFLKSTLDKLTQENQIYINDKEILNSELLNYLQPSESSENIQIQNLKITNPEIQKHQLEIKRLNEEILKLNQELNEKNLILQKKEFDRQIDSECNLSKQNKQLNNSKNLPKSTRSIVNPPKQIKSDSDEKYLQISHKYSQTLLVLTEKENLIKKLKKDIERLQSYNQDIKIAHRKQDDEIRHLETSVIESNKNLLHEKINSDKIKENYYEMKIENSRRCGESLNENMNKDLLNEKLRNVIKSKDIIIANLNTQISELSIQLLEKEKMIKIVEGEKNNLIFINQKLNEEKNNLTLLIKTKTPKKNLFK